MHQNLYHPVRPHFPEHGHLIRRAPVVLDAGFRRRRRMDAVGNQRFFRTDKTPFFARQLVKVVPVQRKIILRMVPNLFFIVRAGRTADRIAKPDTAPLDPGAVRQKMETQRQAQYLFYQPDHVKWLRNGFHFPLFLRHADREIIARKQQQIRIFLPGF